MEVHKLQYSPNSHVWCLGGGNLILQWKVGNIFEQDLN